MVLCDSSSKTPAPRLPRNVFALPAQQQHRMYSTRWWRNFVPICACWHCHITRCTKYMQTEVKLTLLRTIIFYTLRQCLVAFPFKAVIGSNLWQIGSLSRTPTATTCFKFTCLHKKCSVWCGVCRLQTLSSSSDLVLDWRTAVTCSETPPHSHPRRLCTVVFCLSSLPSASPRLHSCGTMWSCIVNFALQCMLSINTVLNCWYCPMLCRACYA